MKVIVLAAQKGGAGKTTLAGHLGVQASMAGKRVAFMDTDPQGSLASWWNARGPKEPVFIESTVADLPKNIEKLKPHLDILIIDTPPAVTETIRSVVKLADLVIIPARPSPHDLRAVGATIDIVEEAGARMLFVMNGAAHRARIALEAALALSQYGAVAPVTIYQRTDFAWSMTNGLTVNEVDPSGKSAGEIKVLWESVESHLNRSRKRN